MEGYSGDAATAIAPAADIYYRTGDVARRDSDGYLWYVGRADDVFKSSDYRISPFELESVAIEHPAIGEAAVVPSPDPLRLADRRMFDGDRLQFEGRNPVVRRLEHVISTADVPEGSLRYRDAPRRGAVIDIPCRRNRRCGIAGIAFHQTHWTRIDTDPRTSPSSEDCRRRSSSTTS